MPVRISENGCCNGEAPSQLMPNASVRVCSQGPWEVAAVMLGNSISPACLSVRISGNGCCMNDFEDHRNQIKKQPLTRAMGAPLACLPTPTPPGPQRGNSVLIKACLSAHKHARKGILLQLLGHE